MEDKSEKATEISVLSFRILMAQVYGPYAFGVLSLLIIWFSIVKPELDSSHIDFMAHQELLKIQSTIVINMEAASKTSQMTAMIMERTVNKLEKFEERLGALNDKSN